MRESDVVAYLLSRGLIETVSILDGDLRVIDISRRNANFRVEQKAGRSYFIKKNIHNDPLVCVSREAQCYRLISEASRSTLIRNIIPEIVHHDEEEDLLILELCPDAEDLRRYHQRLGRFPRWVAACLGRALADLHATPLPAAEADPGRRLTGPEPAGFYLHRPGLTVLFDFSTAATEIIRLVQRSPDVCDRLDTLRREWRPTALIHHDVRWDNVLIVRPRPGASSLKVIDWEAAGLGDPAWDLGSLLGDYVSFWVSSIPLNARAEPASYLELATFPIASMQPAIRALWAAYVRRAGLAPPEAEALLPRVARYAGLKLMHTSLESVQASPECTMTAICLLQVGVNMLLRPSDAAGVLFGIPATSGDPS